MERNTTRQELERRVRELEREVRALRAGDAPHPDRDAVVSALLDAPTESTLLVDRQMRVLAVNEVLARRFGKTADEMIGMGASDFLPGEVARLRMDRAREVFDTGRPCRFTDEREGRVLENHVVPALDREGRVDTVAIYARDVTDALRTAQALREKEVTARTILDALHDVVILVDRQGTVLHGNETAASRFHVRAEELVGRKMSEMLLPPEVAAARKVRVEEVFRTGKPVRFEDERCGTCFDNLLCPVFDEHGTVAKVAVLARDITDRKRIEEELWRARTQLEATLNALPDLLFEVDLDGHVFDVRAPRPEVLSGSPREFVGRSLFDVMPRGPAEKVRKTLRGAQRAGVHRGEVYGMDTPAGRRWFELSAATKNGAPAPKTRFVVLVRDITDRKRMEEEIARGQRLDSLGVLAGGIAHDFNNILTAILANLSLARLYGALEEETLEMLADAETAALRAKGLTQQLISFAKGGEPVKKPVALASLIRETSAFALSGSNVACRAGLPEDLWMVEADEAQIGQVMQNLLINADQAMPDGGVLRVRAENVRLGEDGAPAADGEPFVRVSVEDQGSGIPAKHLPRVFDPFFTTKEKGRGLGLSTAFSIVARHGGRISVESGEGKGATFHVLLPAVTAAREEEPRAVSGVEAPGQGRVLLVDDEEIVRKSAGKILRRLGYEVETAADGEQGLKRYREARAEGRPFAAVILDLTIPGGMGGKKAAPLFLEADPGARLIVSSGYSEDPVMADHRSHGFTGVALKPYRVQDLGRVLREVIGPDAPPPAPSPAG